MRVVVACERACVSLGRASARGRAFRAAAGLALAWGSLAFACAGASALPQRGHVLGFSFGAKGSGEGQLSGPDGVAVADDTGSLYVSDRKNQRVEIFKPKLAGGALAGEEYVGQAEVPGPSAIAVDESGLETDPSAGDVYVVGGSGHKVIYKLSAEGTLLGEISRFVAEGEKRHLEAIQGLAVDSSGQLLAYQEDGAIATFSDAVANEYVSELQTALSKGSPGFALDTRGDFYAGSEGAGNEPVIAKLEAERASARRGTAARRQHGGRGQPLGSACEPCR